MGNILCSEPKLEESARSSFKNLSMDDSALHQFYGNFSIKQKHEIIFKNQKINKQFIWYQELVEFICSIGEHWSFYFRKIIESLDLINGNKEFDIMKKQYLDLDYQIIKKVAKSDKSDDQPKTPSKIKQNNNNSNNNNVGAQSQQKLDLLKQFFQDGSNDSPMTNNQNVAKKKKRKIILKKINTKNKNQNNFKSQVQDTITKHLQVEIIYYNHVFVQIASRFEALFFQKYNQNSFIQDEKLEEEMIKDVGYFIQTIEELSKIFYRQALIKQNLDPNIQFDNSYFNSVSVKSFCQNHPQIIHRIIEHLCMNNQEKTEQLWNNMVKLSSIRPENLGVNPEFCLLNEEIPYQTAIDLLQKINEIKNPLQVLEDTINLKEVMCKCIQKYYQKCEKNQQSSNTYPQNQNSFQQQQQIGIDGDSLMQIFAYILVRAQLPEILNLFDFVEKFTERQLEDSDEDSYCFAMLKSSLIYILNLQEEEIQEIINAGNSPEKKSFTEKSVSSNLLIESQISQNTPYLNNMQSSNDITQSILSDIKEVKQQNVNNESENIIKKLLQNNQKTSQIEDKNFNFNSIFDAQETLIMQQSYNQNEIINEQKIEKTNQNNNDIIQQQQSDIIQEQSEIFYQNLMQQQSSIDQ